MPTVRLTIIAAAFVATAAVSAACERDEYRSTARDAVGSQSSGYVDSGSPNESRSAQPDSAARPSGGHVQPGPTSGEPVPVEDGVARFLELEVDVPEKWSSRPPSNDMRAAEFAAPGEAGEAEVIIFSFPGSGGSIEANIERWRQQFRPEDGGYPEPTVTEFKADGMEVTLVELEGDHQPMLAQSYNEDNILLSAIIDAPVGRIFFQFMGPAPTVSGWADEFEEMLRSMRTTG